MHQGLIWSCCFSRCSEGTDENNARAMGNWETQEVSGSEQYCPCCGSPPHGQPGFPGAAFMGSPGASLRGEARLEWGLVLACAGLRWDTSPGPPVVGQECMPWGVRTRPGRAGWPLSAALGGPALGEAVSGAAEGCGGFRAPRLRWHLFGCAEKLDEILAAAAEPALRPDIADADSRAATVKQRPTSRRITPAEISVSPPGSGGRGVGGAQGPCPLPAACAFGG